MPILPPGKIEKMTEYDMAVLCCIGITIDLKKILHHITSLNRKRNSKEAYKKVTRCVNQRALYAIAR